MKWSDGESATDFTEHTRKRFTLDFTSKKASSSAFGICNVAKWSYNYDTDNNHFYINNNYAYVFLPKNTSGDTEIQIAADLAEPIVIQIDPVQIKTLKYVNIIKNSVDGTMNATYYKGADYQYHTVAGLPVGFYTNMVAPTEQFVARVGLTLSGSGDPTHTNVYTITGKNGLNIVHSGKNVADIYGYSATNRNPGQSSQLSNNYGTEIDTTDPTSESVVVTQSSSTTDYAKNSYRNGYLSVRANNLMHGVSYKISFTITDIISNPLDATLSDMMIVVPGGEQSTAPSVVGNTVIFTITYKDPNEYNRIEIRNCGMSFTLSEFMAEFSATVDNSYEPYNAQSYNYIFPRIGDNLFDASTGVALTTNNIRVARNRGQGVPFHLTGGITYTFSPSSGGTVSQISLLVPYDSTGIKTNYNVAKLTYTPETDVDVGINMYWETGRPENATDIQIELGDTKSIYQPYSTTVYNGSLNILTGVLTVDTLAFTSKLSNYSEKLISGGMVNFIFNNISNRSIKNNNTQRCSIAVYSWNGTEKQFDHFYAYTANNNNKTRVMLYLMDDGSVDESQEFTIIMPLETPYTVQLAPAEVNAYLGYNSVMSDGKDAIIFGYVDKD